MPTELFADNASTTVASGGTTAPVAGTVETWTVASSASFPALAAGQQFHVADQALPAEKIAVTNVSGTSWTVTRGADGTAPAAHAAGFTVVQVVTAGVLAGLVQNPMTAAGDLLYGGASGAPARLAGDTSNARRFLRTQASAGAAQAPAWDGLQYGDLPAVAGVPLGALPAVKITLDGSPFTPHLELASGSAATAHWVYNGSVVATGLTPTVTGPAGSWDVYLYVTDAAGLDALGQVATFNVGYNSSNDNSSYSPAASYNLAAQPVTAVTGIRGMTGLKLFLAEQVTGLSGTLDFTGLAQLTNIELFGSTNVTGVVTSGCGALQRLDQEACSLTSTNLNAVRSMYDFRSAVQASGYLSIQALEGPLVNQYHFCTRDQVVYGMPDFSSDLPAVSQLWPWNCVQAGTLKVRSSALTSLQAHQNWYSSADLTGQFPRTAAAVSAYLDLHSNQLTSVTLTGCSGLQYIDLSSNQLSQAQVDGVLAAVDGWGTSGGTLNLGGNAPPSATGQTHVTSLQGRTWTVTVASSGGPAGTKYTYGENVMVRTASGVANFIRGSLSAPVAAGDLLVAAVEGSATPVVYDSAGNTWTVVGPYGTAVYLAYCLSSAASGTGLTVTAYSGNPVNGLAVGRYTPSSAAVFGGAAGSTPSAGGLNAGANSLGDVGTVPLHSLVWGVLFDDSTAVQGYQGPGYQSGSAGTADKFGFTIPGPNLYGGGAVLYVLDAANADAALTWYGSGTGATGYAASAYFS